RRASSLASCSAAASAAPADGSRRLSRFVSSIEVVSSLSSRHVLAEFPQHQEGERRNQGPAELAQVDLGRAQQAVEHVHLGDEHGQDSLAENGPVHLLAVESGGGQDCVCYGEGVH